MKSRTKILALFLVILLCLSFIGVVISAYSITKQAESIIGPADPELNKLRTFQLAIELFFKRKDLLIPNEEKGEKILFTIEIGESPIDIGRRMESSKIIRDSGLFLKYLLYTGLDKTIQAGNYELSSGMNIIEICQELQDATPTHIPFVVLPGWRLEEISEAIPTSGLNFSSEEFLSMATKPELFKYPDNWIEGDSLEGFLYSGTISIPRDSNLQGFLQTFLNHHISQISNELVEGFTNHGLNVYEAVTLASIIEKEAIVDDEQPLIASVFLNRLSSGMTLDSDPTIQYALGSVDHDSGWWKSPLTYDDLKEESPYNTYKNAGLPPGPISMVSLGALKAVAFPEQSAYYYFRAKCDGSGRHNFAETFNEHLANACP